MISSSRFGRADSAERTVVVVVVYSIIYLVGCDGCCCAAGDFQCSLYAMISAYLNPPNRPYPRATPAACQGY